MKTILAFCGSKGSGKSTSSEIAVEILKETVKVREIAFAGRLKEVCSDVFNLDILNFVDPKLKERELDAYIHLNQDLIKQVFLKFNIDQYTYDQHIRPHLGQVFDTPRKLIQYVGTDLLHPVDPLIHVNYVLQEIDPNEITIITDLRFPQEFNAMYGRHEYLPVYVQNIQAEAMAEIDPHPSEQGWKNFKDKCIRLENNTTKQELTNKIRQILKDYL